VCLVHERDRTMTSSLVVETSIDERRTAFQGVHDRLAQLIPAAGSTTVTAKQLKGLQDAAAALQSLPNVDRSIHDACTPETAAVASSLELLLQHLLEPPAAVFSSFGGAPCEPAQELEASGEPRMTKVNVSFMLQL
jgi:hypothetical protein